MRKLIVLSWCVLIGSLSCSAQIREPDEGNLIKEEYIAMLIDSLAISEKEKDTMKIIRYAAIIPTEFQSIGLVERGSSYMLLALHYAKSYSDSWWYPDVCYRAGMFMMGFQSKEYEALDTSRYWYQLAIREALARKQYKVAGWAYKGQLQNAVIFGDAEVFSDSINSYHQKAIDFAEKARDTELLIATHRHYCQYLLNIGDMPRVDSMLTLQSRWIDKMTEHQRYGFNRLVHNYLARINNLDTLVVLRDAMENYQAERTASRHKQELYAKDQQYEVSKTKNVLLATAGRLEITNRLLMTSFVVLTIFVALVFYLLQLSRKNQKLSERNQLLMHEQNHRVKNNLQFINSLLSLQSQKVTSNDAREALADSQRRINSVALLHRMLYETKDISNVEFTEYVRSLTEEIQYCAGREMNVELELPKKLELQIEKVTSLGLILNELFTNSIKHVDKAVSLRLCVRLLVSGHKFQLVYTDNGRGVSAEIWKDSNTFGNQLIQMQSRQLQGKYEVSAESGFRYTLEGAV